MNILLAPDAFKNCLPAHAVCEHLANGIRAVCPDTVLTAVPLADGGEGTAACFAAGVSGTLSEQSVTDAYFRKKNAHFALSPDGQTALVEMAQASGMQGIDKNHLQTKSATTYGTGELIAAAVKQGAKHIIIGLGGSATTDGGMGALTALGVKFFDCGGQILSPIGENMLRVHTVQAPQNEFFVHPPQFTFACDVENPFYGANGAAYIYAPQKGASAADIKLLDNGLRNLATRYAHAFGRSISPLPSMGAAGGLCGGLYAAFGGAVKSGFDILARLSGLEEKICAADLVITGEGRTDAQTAFGKLPARVRALAEKHHVPCVLISGDITADFDAEASGYVKAIALKALDVSVQYAIENAPALLFSAAQKLMKGLKNYG